MKKITYFTLLFAAVLISGCKKYKVEFDQPTQVEFKPITVTLAKGTVAAPGSTTILVQLVGPQQSTDISVPYTIDATSTAVAGTHYTAAGTAGTIVIPANTSSGRLVITAIPANLTASRRLILNLTDGATIPVSQNFKKCTITMQ